MEYHRTKDSYHVKKLLGHKSLQSTEIYINIEQAMFSMPSDEFHVKVAHNVEEAAELVKVGFEFVTGDYKDGGKIFRKREQHPKSCYYHKKVVSSTERHP